ncbi:hypothetical protein [Micromonospora inyonensis]|uniref:Uncharacterized protein n=1 Tax=Micromonospora inyonensis TaxID=47866 RepID=A0A1C6RWE2_9ACTN|nr:hypothetical protein [Micromonospora inyonensis]SCL21527.1 hypothetical protein GA0074694_3061 [Micromonospora inyonensis]SCL21748.1 hypothetical protein GA0074694_3133 [Micromonospora inyonensis]
MEYGPTQPGSTVPASQSTEPLWTVGGITAAVTATLALLVAFGLEVTDEQETAILGVVAVVAPLIVTAVARGRVYAPATVARLLSGRR